VAAGFVAAIAAALAAQGLTFLVLGAATVAAVRELGEVVP
jgi:hypothetical protein